MPSFVSRVVGRRAVLGSDETLALVEWFNLLGRLLWTDVGDDSFSRGDAALCFCWSRMYVYEEVMRDPKARRRLTSLSFTEFLEAFVRVASVKQLPTRVEALSGLRVAAAAAGPLHSFAVLRDGRAFAWGSAAHDQLGVGPGMAQQLWLPTELGVTLRVPPLPAAAAARERADADSISIDPFF